MRLISAFLYFAFMLNGAFSQTVFKKVMGIDSTQELVIDSIIEHRYFAPNEVTHVDRNLTNEEYSALIPHEYLADIPDGIHSIYILNDSNYYLWSQFSTQNGILNSAYLVLNPNQDTLIHYQYRNGLKNGYQRRICQCGSMEFNSWYVINDTLSGPAEFYNEDEGFYEEGTFNNGIRIGMWIEYDSPETKHTNFDKVYYFGTRQIRIKYRNGIKTK